MKPAPSVAEQTLAASGSRQVNCESAGKAAPAAKVADEYACRAFELMIANINASLECARRLAKVKTPTEFVELSAGEAWVQLNTIVKQAAELGSIAQRLAAASIRRAMRTDSGPPN